MAESKYEELAVSLFVCSASWIQKMWMDGADSYTLEEELKAVGMSPDLAARTANFMFSNKAVKHVYEGVGKTTLGVYSGGDPHPSKKQAEALLKKLHDLDAGM